MITVRYPNGQAITYNDADFLIHGQHDWELCSGGDPSKGGRKIVLIQASAGVTVEFVRPCKVENATLTVEIAAEVLAKNPAELRRLSNSVLRDLKRAVHEFNARSGRWK